MNGSIYWLDAAPPPQSALGETLTADATIVGGGFTGLATAIHLKRLQPEMEVVLLDAQAAGGGSSGRNLGLTPTPIGNRIIETLGGHGRETTAALHRAGLHGIELIETLCADYDIDCDFSAAGSILIATDPGEGELLRRQARAYAEIGAEAHLLDAGETARRFGTIETVAGLYLPFNRDLHPGKLVLGMKRAALALGVRIFDNSPCVEILAGDTGTVRTNKGEVRTAALVLATGGYRGPAPSLNRKIRQTYSYVIASEPLSNRQWDALAWPDRENIYSTHTQFWCLRTGRDGRLFMVDATNAHCPFDQNRDASTVPATFAKMSAFFHRRFPELADLEFKRGWGGKIALTMDGLPSIGRLEDLGNVHFAEGYSGRGVLMSQVAGQTMAERIVGRDLSFADNPLLDRHRRDFPPNIAAWLGINLTFAKLRWQRRNA